MLTTIQIVLLLFVIFALTRVFLRLREKVIPIKTALFWALIWISAIVGILLPTTTTKIASVFGVGRGVDVIVYISLVLLFYLVFRIYVMIGDIRHEITSVVRKTALQNAPKSSEEKENGK
ncbi:MAG: DUF2304 family protein [Candidatus Curtissbacteria bacterium]